MSYLKDRIRRFLYDGDLTQQEFADLVRLSGATISRAVKELPIGDHSTYKIEHFLDSQDDAGPESASLVNARIAKHERDILEANNLTIATKEDCARQLKELLFAIECSSANSSRRGSKLDSRCDRISNMVVIALMGLAILSLVVSGVFG